MAHEIQRVQNRRQWPALIEALPEPAREPVRLYLDAEGRRARAAAAKREARR